MTQLHTPGPYVLWDDGRTIGIESADVDTAGETFPIAVWEVVDYGDNAAEEQLQGDQHFAYLAISNYYKMLEALKRALFLLESPLIPACINGAGGVDLVRQAIAAATGSAAQAQTVADDEDAAALTETTETGV